MTDPKQLAKELREPARRLYEHDPRRVTQDVPKYPSDVRKAQIGIIEANLDTILAALEAAPQLEAVEKYLNQHINNQIEFYASGPNKFRLRFVQRYTGSQYVDGDSIAELLQHVTQIPKAKEEK